MGAIARLKDFVAGTPAVADEVDAEFNQIIAVLTGNVDAANLANGGVTKVKLAPDSLNAFLKLHAAADKKWAFGGPINDGAAWGGIPDHTQTIAHGLPSTPTWWIAWASVANSTASATDPVMCSRISEDATNLVVKLRTGMGGNCNLPGVAVSWAAIY